MRNHEERKITAEAQEAQEEDSGKKEWRCYKLRSKDLNDVKIDELGLAPAYPVPSLRFVFISSYVG